MKYLQNTLSNNFKFIILFFLLNYLTMGWQLIDKNKIDLAIYYGFTVFFMSFIAAAIIFLIPLRFAQKVIKSLCLLINIVPFIMEAFIMHTYNILINAGVICSLLETTTAEAREYITMYIGFKGLLAAIIIAAAVVLVFRLNIINKIAANNKVKKYFTVISLSAGIISTGIMFIGYSSFFSDNDFLPLQRVASAMNVAVKNKEAYEHLEAQVNSKENIKITENNSSMKNVVFILGEATNRNHMNLYGYYLPNTPHLDELNKKGDIAVFRDVVSAHSTTIASLSKVFTFCHHESSKPWYNYNNLIDVMNAAGYKTYWLSNQESSGIWGSVAHVFADHSTEHVFTKLRDSHEDYGIVDGNLFPLIDKAIADRSDKKNFYVFHLMGCHALYYNRFPYSFSKFSKDDIRLPLTDRQKTIVAQYDNAILYNDYIVTNIFAKFRDMEAIVIYMPDHSEAIYDEGDTVAGHFEGNANRHMIEIPFIIWASDKWKARYPKEWAQIKKSVNNPYMTDDMIHTVLDIVGVKTPEFDATRSIVNPLFNPNRPRIFNDKNYDTQIKNAVTN
ncbi:phosphoethanolamine transferase [Pectinatus brassicae]|uniref:Heptose-I-phosphate ethanolaminephosphotransferase n=1 Tax=Pectinatus brassicae TaxID=862415 RepID=A0A840UR75_9FIRM|nr:phosphoethanolamine transferase [Pectinatus brassicae]MBB5336662.1 heptose-I-phosphate ethanolaminephosphotransferase [Pectinatus brassicae]